MPNVVGWVVMEMPAVVGFATVYLLGDRSFETVPLVLGGMWMVHYLHRTLVFPFRVRTRRKRMRLVITALALVFNTLNSYIVARWISEFGHYEPDWLRSPQFIVGATMFLAGFLINYRSDDILIHLRRPGETGYHIPRGWLFEYVTCPNYLGEIVEWSGFAIATWSYPGLAFALFTAANLVPRAAAHHRWYRDTFSRYPQDRKALIPFLW
jgi:steroid 5-alpha reductase family enzyme